MKPIYQTIIFDLDGTLTDNQEGITNSILHALGKMGIREKKTDLSHFIGPPLHESFEKFYFGSPAKALEAVNHYREYYKEKGIFQNKPYPGIEEMLKELTDKERKLYVATSKPTVFARKILDHFSLSQYLIHTEGSTLDNKISEKRIILEKVISIANPPPRSSPVMIGDREYDILAAHHHGIDSIAVQYGFGGQDELIKCKPTYMAKSVADLHYLLFSAG